MQQYITRWSVLQKVRGHPAHKQAYVRRAATACKHRVSGSVSLPFRGSFHLSLTVLCAIGSCLVFSLGRWSSRFQAGFLVSCPTQVLSYVVLLFSPIGLSPSFAGLPSTVRLTTGFIPTTQGIMHCPTESPTTPMMQLCIHITHHRFGLFQFRSPLLSESLL